MKTTVGRIVIYVCGCLFTSITINAQCPTDPSASATCTSTISANSAAALVVTTGQVVCITGGTQSGAITVQTGGLLIVSGGTISNQIAVQTGGALVTSGGTLNNSASIALGGSMYVKNTPTLNGTLAMAGGTLNVLSGGTLSKDITPTVASTLNNCGTISGNPSYNQNMTLNNYSTKKLTLNNGRSTVNNYASNDTITYLAIDNGVNFNNYGATGVVLNVSSGNPNSTVNITNDASSSITVVTNTGNTNCSTSLGNTTNITNNGTMTFPNSLCVKAGLVTNTKNLTFQNQLALNGGTVETKSGGTTTINVLTKNGGNFNVYDGSTIPITTINNFSGNAITMMNAGCSYVTLATPPSVSFNVDFTANGSNTAPNGINYCGGVPINSAAATNTIASVADNGSGIFRITFSSSSNTPNNNAFIAISGVTGGNINGFWKVTKISATVYDLIGAPYSAVTSLSGNTVYINNLHFGTGSYLGYSGCTNPCIPLPVKLVSFKAYKEDNSVKIVWQSVEEKNNQYYVIEKSTDGINYQTVSTVDGKKNSTSLVNYTEYDYSPLSGTSYYRLKQVDMDGSYTYSSISAVNYDGNQNWAIFPNPSIDGSFTIRSTFAENEIIAVSVMDVTGNRVKYYSSEDYAQEMNITGLASGLYIVSIQTVTETYSKKLIVQ